VVRPRIRKEVACELQKDFGLSERRACDVVKISRTAKRYIAQDNDSEIRDLMRIILVEKPRYGCPRVHQMLRRKGILINHKRTARIYRAEGLQLSKRPPKRKRRRPMAELPRPSKPCQKWSLDFVHDNLSDGRSIRILTAIDEFTRECVAMEVDTSINANRVINVLERLETLPNELGLDQGPEFVSTVLEEWTKKHDIKVGYCKPGNKNENAFIESFNGRLRDECLNMHWFSSLKEARTIIEDWRIEYNNNRPHSGIGGLTPSEFAKYHEYVLVA